MSIVVKLKARSNVVHTVAKRYVAQDNVIQFPGQAKYKVVEQGQSPLNPGDIIDQSWLDAIKEMFVEEIVVEPIP